MQFAQVVHQLLCSLPTSAMDDSEDDAAEAAPMATLLPGGLVAESVRSSAAEAAGLPA